MDELKIQYYLDQIPVEIREAVMELDTPHKWAVYIALTIEGDKYFNEIKKQFDANPNTIDKIIKSLIASGVVVKKVKQLGDIGNSNKTYYTTTKLGEKLLRNLYEVVLPPLAIGDPGSIQYVISDNPAVNIEFQPGNNPPYEIQEIHKSLTLQFEGART